MYVWLCMKRKSQEGNLPSRASNSAHLYPLSHLKCVIQKSVETGTESSRPVWSSVVRPHQSVWHLVGAQKAFVKHLSCIMNLFPVPPACFQHRPLRMGFSVPALRWPQASQSVSSSWTLVLVVTVVALAPVPPDALEGLGGKWKGVKVSLSEILSVPSC